MTDIDFINSSACIGGDIAKEYRGNGFSTALYKLIFNLAFNEMNLNRCWLLVLDYNQRAKHIYEKLGFVYEGKQRKAVYKDGQYHDYHMMSILKEEYENDK
jgi:RimJ/RimL family protein N-acetyltransferase